MFASPQKSYPINPITGQQLSKPSTNYEYNKTMQSFNQPNNNNEKPILVNKNSFSIDEEELQKKVNEFLSAKITIDNQNTDQYHDQCCVCPDCVYERNLNKPSHTLFNLTMRTVYNQSFTDSFNKKEKANQAPKFQKHLNECFNGKHINENQSSLHPKNKVSFQTIYKMEMRKGNTFEKTKLLKNEDLLKFDGPITNTTTYKQKFPGVSGGNPYVFFLIKKVKPVDKAVRERFRLNSTTMNSTFYTGQFTSRSALAKSPDNIKTGLPMICKQSTSQKFYSKPLNPQQYNKNYLLKSIEKKVESPHDKHQFESIYRNSFYGNDALEAVKHKKRLVRQTISRLGMSN